MTGKIPKQNNNESKIKKIAQRPSNCHRSLNRRMQYVAGLKEFLLDPQPHLYK